MDKTYLSTLCRKYGITVGELATATGTTLQGARHWWNGRSLPMAYMLPDVVRLLQRYEPKLTADALLERENVGRRKARPTRSGRAKDKAK
jgi:hypothetical protein